MKYYVTTIEARTCDYVKTFLSLEKAETPEDAMRQACENQLHYDFDSGSCWDGECLIDGDYQFVYYPYKAVEVEPEHVEIVRAYFDFDDY